MAEVYRNQVMLGLTQAVRVMFTPKLGKPEQIGGKGDAKYEVQVGFDFDHPDFQELVALTKEMINERFGAGEGDLASMDKDAKYEVKFKYGDVEADYAAQGEKAKNYDFMRGLCVMKLRSKNPIAVLDARQRDEKGNPIFITDPDDMQRIIYSGCYVALTLTAATYPAAGRDGRPGVTFYPEQICFVADGERLAGGAKNDPSAFAAVQGQITDEDPTQAAEAPKGF